MRLVFLILFAFEVVLSRNPVYSNTHALGASFAQPEEFEKIDALNNYVDFINESTHGLLIVVKLLENFNLDINQYVDLASYQINQYNNNDLPKDIFEDLDHWFYEETPYELFEKAISGGTMLQSKAQLDALARKLKSMLSRINQIRFELEDIIKAGKLDQKENLNKVYDKLEEGVKLYEDFYSIQLQMENLIKKEKAQINHVNNYTTLTSYMDELYGSSRELLIRLRNKKTENYIQILKLVQNSAQKIINFPIEQYPKMTNSRFRFNWNNLKTASTNLVHSFEGFHRTGELSEQYKIYGKFYYYYNVTCISKFNRYGTGIVSGINNVMKQLKLPLVRYTELPHYFKVIYPKKLEKINLVEMEDRVIQVIPNQVKERTVANVNKKIRVTSELVEFLFYDHMIQDGDVASVSFNGEWIMEKVELELAPKKFMLKLNKKGKNYLLLHADNIGARPPCTIGISYMMGGSKKEITLSSDLSTSEIVEIEIVE